MSKLKIQNSSRTIKINNIYCIGRNYFDHIKESGNNKKSKDPIIFLKPNSSLIGNNGVVSVPIINNKRISNNLQHEVELVVVISKNGKNIKEKEVNNYVLGYAVGIDMTLRDVQSKSKKKGNPWVLSKGFLTSAPISDIILQKYILDPMNLEISLFVNNDRRQFTNTSLMIYNIYKLIAYISSVFSVKKGDLIFTGTPSGISKLKSKDIVIATLENFLKLKVSIN